MFFQVVEWGTSRWNCWDGGFNVFLIGVIEFAGGWFVRVWDICVSDVDEPGRVLYAYWTCGSIWGSCA